MIGFPWIEKEFQVKDLLAFKNSSIPGPSKGKVSPETNLFKMDYKSFDLN